MTSTTGIPRPPGISRTIFVISLVIVAAVSGVTGYFVAGFLKPSAPTISLNGAGATFPFPFLSAVSANYSRSHPNVQINYNAQGSGFGVAQITAKTVDFGASDAPLTTAQIQSASNLLQIPETIGSVVVAYNLGAGFPTGIKLNASTIAKIFQGDITSWTDPAITGPNTGFNFPNHNLTSVHRSDKSGTTFVFSRYLVLAAGSVWRLKNATSITWPSGLGAFGNQGVAGVVLGTQYTIGYVELAYAIQNNMNVAYVQNGDGNTFVRPSLTNVTYAVSNASVTQALPAGNQNWGGVSLWNAHGTFSYPIVSFTYLLVYQDLSVGTGMTLDRAKALVDFLWFTIHGGQSIAISLAFAALPSAVVRVDETTIQSIVFNGQPLPT